MSLPDGVDTSDIPGAEANRLAGDAWIAQVERDSQRESYLDSAKAFQNREDSKDAYSGHDSVSEVISLLRQKFGEELSALDQDPGRALSEVEVKRFYDASSALVASDGRPELVDSTIPLRAEENGETGPVDLKLQIVNDQFRTVNGLVDTSLPMRSDEQIRLGSTVSFSIDSVDADRSTVGQILDDQSEVLPQGAGTDQDLILSPISVGVDVATLIRSSNAAESYELDFDFPARVNLSKRDDGSVVARDGDDVLVRVLAPFSVDAQGQDVPSRLEVSGQAVSVVTEFKGGDYAMPIYTDPVVATFDPNGFSNSMGWGFATDNTGNSAGCQFSWAWYYGAIVQAPGSCLYKNSTWGQYLYYPPGSSTFIKSATFSPLGYSDACGITGSQIAEPHGYVGIYRRMAPADWRSLSTFGPPVSSASMTTTPASVDLTRPYDVAVVGMGTPQVSTPGSYPNLCNRLLLIQGASVSMSDPEPPDVTSLTHGNPGPDGSFAWVDSTGNATIQVTAYDPGLGVAGTAVYYPKAGGSWFGDHEVVASTAPTCSATAASPCPSSHTGSPITYSLANFGEGATPAQGWAWDPLWWAHQDDWWGVIHQAGRNFDVRIDRTPPDVAITGSATGASGNHLSVLATDGSPSPASARRSGVKSLVVSVGGTQVFNQTQGCAPALGSCSMAANLDLSTTQFDEGPLSVSATAKDQLGDQVGLPNSHTKTSTSTIYLGGPEGITSITGGPGGFTADSTPSFTYTSTTSGSAFKCKVDSGAWIKCGAGGYTTSALSDGAHTFYVRNWYGPGSNHPNPSSRSFVVDTQGPSISATAPLNQISSASAGREVRSNVTASDAGSGAVKVTFALDDDAQDAISQTCPSGGCSLQGDLEAHFTSDDAEGTHTYAITASDAVGNVTTKSGDLTLDAANPILAVTGDLPDSAGELLTADTVTATIDTEDSRSQDTGVTKVQVLVDGEVDYSQTVSCSPSCPATYQANYTYDKTEWSEGGHEVIFLATDAAGNTAREAFEVDVAPDPPVNNCPSVVPVQQSSHDVFSETQAVDGFAGSATSVIVPSTPATDPDSGQELAPYWIVQPDDGAPFVSGGSRASSMVGSGPAGGFGVHDEFCLMPMQTTADETPAAMVSHEGPDLDDPNTTSTYVDAVVLANAATDTDLAIRATATGATAVARLRGNQAPTELSWKLGIESGLELRELTNGGLAIVDPLAPKRDLDIPTRDVDAQNIDHVRSVSVQLAESAFQLASAEDELDEYVYTVIAAPYGVAEDGTVTNTTWSVAGGGEITVDIPTDTLHLVMPTFDDPNNKAPKPVAAHYASWVDPIDLAAVSADWGCDFSNSLESDLKGDRVRNMIVDYGPAARDYSSGVGLFGGINWGNNPLAVAASFVPREKIRNALVAAVDGYRDCSQDGNPPVNGQRMRLVLGMSNQENTTRLISGLSNPPSGQALDDLLTRNSELAGMKLNATIQSVKEARPNVANIQYGVGMDAETGWGRADLSKRMAFGMARGAFSAYDYGTAGGCKAGQSICKNGWTKSDVALVSQGWPNMNKSYVINALPEIYWWKPDNISQWAAVAKHWRDQNHTFRFDGITFQAGDNCDTYFPTADIKPHKSAAVAWNRLRNSSSAPNLGREIGQIDCPWAPSATPEGP